MGAQFTTGDMIAFLRKSMNLPDPDSGDIADERLVMTDEDLILTLNIALSKDFSGSSIEDVPESAIYPIKLLAQRELCIALAVRYAEEYDITADNNNQLKESQKFQHYMKLAEHFDDLYEQFIDNGGIEGHVINAFDIFLDGQHYFAPRSIEKRKPPSISVKIQNIDTDSIELSWDVKGLRRLLNYKVFISEEPIIDMYAETKINPLAQLVTVINDNHQNRARIKGLTATTAYHVAVVVTEQNGLRGLAEIKATTLSQEEGLSNEDGY